MKLYLFFIGITVLFFSCSLMESQITIDNQHNTIIVIGEDASIKEANIVQLLQQKIQERTGVSVHIVNENEFNIETTEFETLILPGQLKSNKLLVEIMKSKSISFPDKKESYALTSERYKSKNIILIAGSDELGVLYGEGKFLRNSIYDNDVMQVSSLKIAENPVDNSRGIYYAIHCNNWYEDIPEIEKIKDLIKEQGLWGANLLWMWFDLSMYHKSPFEKNSDSYNKWERMKQLAKAANNIGMKVGFVEIANASYLDQVDNKLEAVKGDPPGGLLCPHANNGEAMLIMDRNYRDLYQDLQDSGISVNAFSLAFYDRGGCQCNLCQPWIMTGVKFIGERHSKTIKEYFPDCDIYLNDWHLEVRDGVDEVEWVKDYLKSSDSGWIKGINRDDRHAWNRWAGIDQKYEVTAFFDISMIGGWGGFGTNPFPKRLDAFFNEMRANGIMGGMAYSEGIFEDINKVLTLQHHWGQCSSESIIKEYARWYFSADNKTQKKISDVLFDMESEWTDIYGSWWSCQPLVTQSRLNIKNRIDSLEMVLPVNMKKTWRWKLIHSRANLAQLAVEISGLEGSGFDEFISEMTSLSSTNSNMVAREKEIWLNQKIQQFDAEYEELYHGIYEGTKVGMYGAEPPDPGRWIKGFNKGDNWRELLGKY